MADYIIELAELMSTAITQTLASLGMNGIFLLGLGVVLAAVIRAFSGFGMALAIVPIAAMMIPTEQAIVLAVLMAICVSIPGAVRVYQDVDSKPFPWLLGGALVGLPVGIYFLTNLPDAHLRIVVGLAVILSSIMLGLVKPKVRQLPRRVASLVGVASGVLNGTVAMPGPPIIVYFLATQENPAVSRSSMMVYFLFSNFLALAGFAWAGILGVQSLVYLAISLPFLLVGDKLGFVLFDRFGSDWYRKAAVVMLFIIGSISIWKAL